MLSAAIATSQRLCQPPVIVVPYHHLDQDLIDPEDTPMSSQENTEGGICILSFDNGGPGCHGQLMIVKEYMGRLSNDLGVAEDDLYPADYFDLMGGVGFGGLAAFLLGYLRMNASQAIDTLAALGALLYTDKSEPLDLERNSEKLKEFMEITLTAGDIPLGAKIYDKHRSGMRCKVVLYAASSANVSHPQAFRTYSSRGSSLNPTIVEAICATMASPSHFLPVKIGPRLRQQRFIGGALGTNNPTRELLKEACTVFGKNRRVTQIISLGSGVPRVLSTESSNEASVDRLAQEMAADCEAVAYDLTTRLFNMDSYLRLSVDRGMEDVGIEDWGLLGDIETHTRVYIEGVAVTEAIDSSLRRLREKIGIFSLGQLTHSTSIKFVAKKVPSVSPHYVVRREYETLVHHLVSLAPSQEMILPITGMGGCGKTQLVSYFLREHPTLFNHTVFVDASSSSSTKADLQTWARTLGDGHERDVWEDALRILANAPADERWALILDNADDPALNLVPFLPKRNNVTVVITSRIRDLGNLSTTHHVELGEMRREEALATLLKSARRQTPISPEELESAHALMKDLGCLAVALVQVGTYCHQMSSGSRGVLQPYTFTQYLALFRTHRAELMKKAEPSSLDSYERGAYTTLDLSYSALPQAGRDFLHFISHFRYTDIPLVAFAAAANYGFGDRNKFLPRPEEHRLVIADVEALLCVNGKWSELHVHEIIHILCSFSLLSTTSTPDSVFLQLHPLIQAWSRDMNLTTSQRCTAMALHVLTSCGGRDDPKLDRLLLPHIIEILDQMGRKELHFDDLMAAGASLQSQGYYHKAAELFETALEVVENADSKSDMTRVGCMSWLGTTYSLAGKWDEARKLQVEVLEQSRKIRGKEHPDTITEAENLAYTYQRQGKWNEAEKLEVEVLEQRRNILGKKHPHTITAAGNLASTYREQRKWDEAENLEVEVLEQFRTILGKEHPGTISAGAGLAATYYQQGKWDEAEKLQVAVLEQSRRILGVEHPDTISATTHLASTYHSQGKWDEAKKLDVEVLEQRRKVLGTEHPKTINAVVCLAATYHMQGRWEEDAALLALAVQLSLKVLGQRHPSTQGRISSLAVVYERLGKQKEAQETRALLIS